MLTLWVYAPRADGARLQMQNLARQRAVGSARPRSVGCRAAAKSADAPLLFLISIEYRQVHLSDHEITNRPERPLQVLMVGRQMWIGSIGMAQIIVSWFICDGRFYVHTINAVGRRSGRIIEIEDVDTGERIHGTARRLEGLLHSLRSSNTSTRVKLSQG
jgi:hypothetical protein